MRTRRTSVLAGTLLAAAALILVGSACTPRLLAQEPGEQSVGRGQFAGMQRVGGVVTAVSGPQVTIKGEDGTIYQVVTTDNTRMMRGRGVNIKISDLKPGDGVMAMGNLDAANKSLHAGVLMAVDPEQMKKIEEARKQEMANLGKTNIIGRVTAVDLDNAAMTVERIDGISQTIGFDEGTSFRRGRPNLAGPGFNFAAAGAQPPNPNEMGESITLADVKVGDRVAGPGEVKGGRFVAKQLSVMTPRAGRGRGAAPGNGSQPGAGPQSQSGQPPR